MPHWLMRTTNPSRTASEIYGPIVASARQPTFFAAWGVPDTTEGRFEMLVLHVVLVMRRLEQVGAAGRTLSRALAETFITDMDDNMREIGIGDLAVPRKIKRAAAALMDRHRDYGAALAEGDCEALAAAISAAIAVGRDIPGLDCTALASYTERLSGVLAITADTECLAGKFPLPWSAV